MSLKHGLLGLLNYGSMTGYELDKAFKDSLSFFWQAQTSQIYRELNTMENLGWLTFEMIYQDDKPNKKLYSLTKEGHGELEKWLMESNEKEGVSVRNSFLMKIFFSGERNINENIQVLKNYRSRCEKELLSLSTVNGIVGSYAEKIENKEKVIYWGATAEFGCCYYEMCIKWANDMIKRLEDAENENSCSEWKS